MKKHILIIGGDCTGKTRQAKEICSHIGKDEVVYIHYQGREPFIWPDKPFFLSECTKKKPGRLTRAPSTVVRLMKIRIYNQFQFQNGAIFKPCSSGVSLTALQI